VASQIADALDTAHHPCDYPSFERTDIRSSGVKIDPRERLGVGASPDAGGQGFAAMRYSRLAVARYSASPTSAGRE
jgi:hypothetical protein